MSTVGPNNLKAAGIEVVIDTYEPGDEYTAAIDGDNHPDLSFEAWCADWPTPVAVVPALLVPDADGQTWGSNNITRYHDPATAKELQALMSSSESASVATKMSELANKIQTTAWPQLPYLLDKTPEVVGANLTNAGISPLFGVFDLNTVAARKRFRSARCQRLAASSATRLTPYFLAIRERVSPRLTT